MASKVDDMWAAFSSIALDWFGSWTKWDVQTREMKDNFNSLRSLKVVGNDNTVIKHQNTYYLKDGSIVERGPWEVCKEDVDESGVCHPGLKAARVVLHSNGSGVSMLKKIPDDGKLMAEIYLRRDDLRCSIAVVYGESKQPLWFSAVREENQDSPSNYWSSNKELGTGLQFPNSDEEFVGVEKDLDNNLELRIATNCVWNKQNWKKGDNESEMFFFLPDNICLSCPKDISERSVSLRSCVLFNCGDEREIQEVSLTYEDGQFVSLKQGRYHPVNKQG